MLAMGSMDTSNVTFPLWLIILCALAMGLGTAIGGKKIIKSVGMDMVKMEPYQGFSASTTTFSCLVLATFTGPACFNHANRPLLPSWAWVLQGAFVPFGGAWQAIWSLRGLLTFPGCGLIGFVLAKLFLLF